MRNVPFFNLTRQWSAIKERVMPRIEALLDTQHCVGGPAVAEFEEKVAHYTGARHAISCGSGTDALWLALHALGIEKNDIILTTPFSFIASSSEIYAHGAHPVFIDVEEKTLNLSPETLSTWLKENTTMKDGVAYENATGFPVKGMVVVNIFGQCADFTKIRAITDAHNIWIVEDAAQSMGAHTSTHKRSGVLGDIATFSFYPTKNLGGAGDGGMMTTNDDALAEKLIRLRAHNREPNQNYAYRGYGVNSRLDAIQAIILSEKLDHLPTYTAHRRAIAKNYSTAFADIPSITLPHEHFFHTYHQYAIRVSTPEQRDAIAQALTERGVGTRVFYPASLSSIAYLQTDTRLYTDCPISDAACKSIVCLPIWPELTREEVEYIISTVIDVTAQYPHANSAKTQTQP